LDAARFGTGYRRAVRGKPGVIARGLRRGQLIAIDGSMAVALLALLPFAILDHHATRAFTGPNLLGLLVAAALAVPVAVRRIWPMPALAVVCGAMAVATTTGMAWGGSGGAFLIPLALTLYMVGVLEPTRRAMTAFVLVLVGTAVEVVLVTPGWDGPAWALGMWLLLSAPWAVARAVRARRGYIAMSAEQLARQAVSDERLRIARELHDIVAHSLSLITVKASIANHVADTRPEEAHDALRVIEDTSRGTLAEMRRLLGVLRSEDGSPELAPSPGLAGLSDLASRAGLAGVRVDLSVRGEVRLPDGVELSVYRIVQEALTNVVKHAAPANCRVLVDADEHEARVEVTDDGPGVRTLPGPTGGHGLIGMRERVMMYDGVFTAGPRAEGGFAVSARLPYHASERS
jgi:signal transduction histidine kinase